MLAYRDHSELRINSSVESDNPGIDSRLILGIEIAEGCEEPGNNPLSASDSRARTRLPHDGVRWHERPLARGRQDVVASQQDDVSVATIVHYRAQRAASSRRGRRDLASSAQRVVSGVIDTKPWKCLLDYIDCNVTVFCLDFARQDLVTAQRRRRQLAFDEHHETWFTRLSAFGGPLSDSVSNDVGESECLFIELSRCQAHLLQLPLFHDASPVSDRWVHHARTNGRRSHQAKINVSRSTLSEIVRAEESLTQFNLARHESGALNPVGLLLR
jgi:hypothetical protein